MWRREVSKTHPMSADEEFEVAMKAREGDRAAKERLIKCNLRFVLSMAKNFSQDPTTLDDLIAVGNIGLVEAAEKFDPTKGFKFISYAVWHIRKEMLNHVYENTRTVKIPISKVQLLARSKKAAGEFLSREGREPTPEEMVEWMNSQETGRKVDLRYLQDLYQADTPTLSFDAPLGEDGSMLSEIIGEEDGEFTKMLSERKSGVHTLLNTLNEQEKFIMKKRFGIEGDGAWDFVDIGREFNKTGEWARAQCNRALRKLEIRGRKHLREGRI